MLIDCHSHLFLYKDFDKKIKENIEKDVKYIIENGLDPVSNRKVLDESSKYNIVLCSFGFHPTECIKYNIDQIEKEIEFIENNSDKIVAIGEIGLDFYWIKDKEKQKYEIFIFKKFLSLAEKLKLPVIVHSRNAERETIDILETYKLIVILHSFFGDLELVKKAIENGFYFSIPAIIYKNKKFQKIVKEIPLDLILTETDSPFLDPIGFRNNNSWKVIYAIKKISEIKKIEENMLKEKIYENFINIFINKKKR